MNDDEIDLMKKLLMMDPYERIPARMAIEHDWFDELRAKYPEFIGDDSSIDFTMGVHESGPIGGSKRILSPELLNSRQLK